MAKPKRPKDTNQLAKFIVELGTGQRVDPDPLEGKDRQRAEHGRRGGLRGGIARAEKLSTSKRREIARAGATARWRKTTSGPDTAESS